MIQLSTSKWYRLSYTGEMIVQAKNEEEAKKECKKSLTALGLNIAEIKRIKNPQREGKE